jgi:nicotinamide mononucleotide (NMN) deamidase PncC
MAPIVATPGSGDWFKKGEWSHTRSEVTVGSILVVSDHGGFLSYRLNLDGVPDEIRAQAVDFALHRLEGALTS